MEQTVIKNPQPEKELSSDKQSAQKFKIKSWYSNRYQIVVVQRNILLVLSIMLMVAMTISTIFIKFVVSSKSLEPYVIEVESKTGVPTIVDQMTSKTLTADESIKKYFLNQFIQSAVGYDPKTFKRDDEIVRLLSSSSVYADFRKRIDPKLLGYNSKIEVKIKSIKFIGSSNIEVRIFKNITSSGNPEEKNEIINMGFLFTNLNLTAEERLINPLGFQVTDFSIAQEISEIK